MKSMTAFSQKRFDFETFSLNITLKSLNHKYLDVFFKGNGITPAIEKCFRTIIKSKILRGKLEVCMDVFEYGNDRWDVQLNEELLTTVLDKITNAIKKYKNEVNFSIDNLLKIPMIFHIDSPAEKSFENEEGTKNITKAIEETLNELVANRAEEGKELSKIILLSISKILENVKAVEEFAADFEEDVYLKYVQKITRFVKDYEIDERRITQEAAIAVEKSCITEEVNRIQVHADKLRSIVKQKNNQGKGKELDFITQEILRETHTIGAKSNSMDIQDHILKIRREVEKIRQQVQNVE